MVKEARKEEVEYLISFREGEIWQDVPEKTCWEMTGKAPVDVKWVDTNSGSEDDIFVRSRLVARDFKGDDKGRGDLFPETPPLEAKRLLLSRAATQRKDEGIRKLLFIDVKKAHLSPPCEDEVFI